MAEAVFHISTPFYITDCNISGDFYRKTLADNVNIYYSTNGTSWSQAWTTPNTGTTHLDDLNIGSRVKGGYEYYLKIQIVATDAGTDAGVSNLNIATSFEHNKGGMAYLDKGVNHITVTCDNPQDLGGSTVLHVVYKWKEYDGTDWTISRVREQYITSCPATFTIDVGGDKVPRTEYVLMEVGEPPIPDPYDPGAVSDLSYTGMDSTELTLTWTATGDDGNTGQATAYDLRTSSSPITDENWSSATPLTGVSAPLEAGNAEKLQGHQPDSECYLLLRDQGSRRRRQYIRSVQCSRGHHASAGSDAAGSDRRSGRRARDAAGFDQTGLDGPGR